jgi:hypothetical protein
MTAHEEFKELADKLQRRSMIVELEILNCMWDEADEYCYGRYEDRVYTEVDVATKALELWRNSPYVNSERKKR